MAHHPEPDEPRVPDQPAHSGFHGNTSGAQLVFWDNEWRLVTYPTLVQAEDWPDRFYFNFSDQLVVS